MPFLAAIVVVVAMLIGGAAVLLFSGTWNPAATEPHPPIVRWAFETALRHSVEARAGAIAVPVDLGEPERVRRGARHFQETCTQCHGAPGVPPTLGDTMRPTPPPLSHAAREWTEAELFWIVENGIRMTGMPAWGPGHSDEELWDVIAFIRTLPTMTAAGYQSLAGPAEGIPDGGD